jgi:hypothetical protein
MQRPKAIIFDLDEDALPIGVEVLTRAAMDFLNY